MMTPFAMVVALGLFAAAAYTVTTAIRVVAQWSLRRHGHDIDAASLEERLARLEASIESLSVQTQRLTDGHRFFTDLLANRQQSAIAATKPPDSNAKSGTA
jgi:hypothetical protein